jgi:glutathionylspermidine synthase
VSYAAFARTLQADGVPDPWLDGAPRLCERPVVLSQARWREACAAAAGIARVHGELARVVTADPGIADRLFGLTRWQLGMWQCAAPDWHGIARADVFFTAGGAKVLELNSDTPSGQPETVALARAARERRPELLDPSAALPARFVAMVEAWARTCGHTGPLTVGLVYPTEITEDLSLIAAYRAWLAARGHRTVLGSPFNVTLAADGRAAVLGTACDAVVRHYKTDWLTERLPVADDDELADDRAPLAGPLLALLAAAVERRTAVVNPFGAVLTQNKRALAACWELLDHFGAEARDAIRRWLPFTARLEAVREELWHDRERWVLKSDYGCEGAEVVVGAHVDQRAWEHALAHTIARRWVAQHHVAPERDADGDVVNHGVWLVGGEPAGALARVHAADRATDGAAPMAAVLVEPEGA